MKNSALQSEPFFYIPSERENEFLEMEQLEYLESEVNRNSSDFRWVQESLNKVLKLRLKVDGVLGAQTRSAIRSFQQRQGLVADGIIGKKTESALKSALGGATVGTVTPPIPPVSPRAPRVLTYTTKDVIDNRISVPAQNSLVRLSKNPTTSSDSVGMLEEVKAGRLAGIYCVNWEKPAKRAIRFGKTWWTVIPKGEDAVLTLDPENLMGGAPLITFRRELDPDCGLLKGEKRFAPSQSRIDAALLKIWKVYLRFRRGEIVPCKQNAAGRTRETCFAREPTVPEMCNAATHPAPCKSVCSDSESNRALISWLQNTLNRLPNTSLPITGLFSAADANALRKFSVL